MDPRADLDQKKPQENLKNLKENFFLSLFLSLYKNKEKNKLGCQANA